MVYIAEITVYKYCKVDWINCIIAVSCQSSNRCRGRIDLPALATKCTYAAHPEEKREHHMNKHCHLLGLCIVVLAFLLCACSNHTASGVNVRPTVSAKAIRIMPLGDSITVGIGSSSSAGYRLRLWQDGEAAHWQFTFVGSQSSGPVSLPDRQHEGHPGWRINQISANIVAWLQTYRPQIVLLQIGSNDIIQDYYPHTAIQRLDRLLEQITNTLPGTIVMVAEITPLRNPILNEKVVTYDHAIPGLVRSFETRGRHVEYVDMYDAVPVSALGDGIHPNTTGYALMAAVWYSALHREIAKTAISSTISPIR
jgi:lysophospholipase L1-like esterase